MKEIKTPILTVYDKQGNPIPIPALAKEGGTNEPIHTTLNVEIETDGFGGYIADYNDNEINNHRNAGGLVQAKYYDMAKNQTYTYYYSTMESDRKPTFIRTYINEQGQTEQVLASVGNDKKVTVERRISKGVSQAYVEQNFANVIRNEAEGTVISVNDVSPFPQIVETRVESKNLFGEKFIVPNEPSRYVEINGVPYYKFKDNKIGMSVENCFEENSQYVITINARRDTESSISFRFSYTDGTFSEVPISAKQFNTNVVVVSSPNKTVKKFFSAHAYEQDVYVNLHMTQLEKGTVSTPYTPYITDLTQARLSVGGTNLFNIKDVKDVAVNTAGAIRSGVKIKMPKGVFTFTAKNGNDSLFIKTQYGKDFGEAVGLGSKFVTVNMRENGYVIIYTSSVEAFNQLANEGILASGDKPRDYIPYEETIYTPNQDGTVEGVQSVSPNMTAFGEGLYVSMKYNADTKKYIDNKFNELTKAVTTAQALALEV